MRYENSLIFKGILCAGLMSAGAFAQVKSTGMPDAQVEANVLKALAAAPQLANQSITSTTAYGTVTLTGSVPDEASRDLAEKIVSNTQGVQKVIDQMTVGASSATNGNAPPPPDGQETNPTLQSDGTYAQPGQAGVPAADGSNPPMPNTATAPPPPQQAQPQYPAPPQQAQGYPPQQAQPAYPAPPQQAQGYPPAGQYPPYRAPYRQPYAPYYGQPQQPYRAQRGGDPVVVPAGTTLQVRINQGMDSRHTAPGTAFNGVMLSDVRIGNVIAIPRGANIQGVVVDAHSAGELKGKGELKLQLTQVSFGGQTYPIATDFWWHQGVDKTGATVGNTVGLGAMGALIGAAAGGGVGAAVGAGLGGVAGLGVSAASGRGEASLPPEAIVSFHLTRPADVTTVSQAELDRLGAGLPPNGPPQMVRRYPPPPPPPPYYGPVYYYPRY